MSGRGFALPSALRGVGAAVTFGDDGSATIDGASLAEPAVFEPVLAAFAGWHVPRGSAACIDRGALVSLWSMYYLSAAIVPCVVGILKAGRACPVSLATLGLAFGDTGLLQAIRLSAQAPTAEGFDTLVRSHLEPFAVLCSRHAGLSPRVFRSNAAVVLNWVLGVLQAETGAPELKEARERLADEVSGLASPFRACGDGRQVRRVCCQRYRLPGYAPCGDICPLARRGVTPAPASLDGFGLEAATL